MPNRLAQESSPYLQQHAENPVDWYPWGEEALRRSRDEDRPIFLSIGYSSCHWCHVMERESFVDAGIAALLNEHFVSIKVDREERPDLDAVYMQAVTAMTGHGGWPLSVWLDPDTVPFYGGTYFPPTPRHGMPSFRQVLGAIVSAWTEGRERLSEGAAQMLRLMAELEPGPRGSSERPALGEADRVLAATFDPVNGGWGTAPKFPQPLVLEYLMSRRALEGSPGLDPAVRATLDAMAAGGMYDHLGGGFHRYSTDEEWLVPHFEKMLYDNAQLARCYLHAWQIEKTPRYRAVVEETLEYLLTRMSPAEGGLFSAEDADSEGREGAFYLWTPEEVEAVLGADEARVFAEAYGVTPAGHIDGGSVLHLSANAGKTEVLAGARAKLARAREDRVRPALDDKVITAWNGLALAALAEAARALPSDRYREAAERLGRFIADHLVGGGYRLVHTWKDGRPAGDGYLDDYAAAIEGLLALYQTTFAAEWFELALGLADAMASRFVRADGGLYDTSDDHETLIVRPRSLHDSPTPAGSSLAATVLLKIAAYTGDDRYREAAADVLDHGPASLTQAPMMHGQWLHAHLLDDRGLTEVAIVGDPEAPETSELHFVVRRGFFPAMVVAAGPLGHASPVPLLAHRSPAGGLPAAAWVCRRHTCEAPTTDPARLTALLTPQT